MAKKRCTVYCDAVPVFDGWTNEFLGWASGSHLIYEMPPDKKCPRCGTSFSKNGYNDGLGSLSKPQSDEILEKY